MICTCSPEGEADAQARWDRIRAWHADSKYPIRDDRDLVDRVIMRLTSAFEEIEITGDQWYGITYRWHTYKDDERVEQEPIYIECDRPTDCIAALFEQVVIMKEKA